MQTPPHNTDPADIITDMVQRLAPVLDKLSAGAALVLAGIEKDLRKTWGGDRVYIPHRRGELSSQLHSERNSRILRAHQQGRHIALIARNENISERWVLKILSKMRHARRPKSMG